MAKINLASPSVIKGILVLQFLPLLLFPPSTFELTSQAWWLPMILVILAVVGTVQIFRKSIAPWPMYLISFAQGFNVISRLLMLMPQSTQGVEGQVFNAPFFILSIISMAISTFILMYVEKPEVKQQLLR
jgi:hypothetical protein